MPIGLSAWRLQAGGEGNFVGDTADFKTSTGLFQVNDAVEALVQDRGVS
jgi:hypothetical protein